YHVGSNDYYAALWEKTNSPYWIARNGMPDSQYQLIYDNYRYQGFQPAYVSAFASGGAARLNAIWTNTALKAADLEAINKAIAGALKSAKIAGLSIAVGKNGKLVYAAGFGSADKESGMEMSVDHKLRIGSISKSVT